MKNKIARELAIFLYTINFMYSSAKKCLKINKYVVLLIKYIGQEINNGTLGRKI